MPKLMAKRAVRLTDAELMAEINAGSTDAFAELYDRYCVRAFRIALSICRDPGNAEVAVQNGFVSIWKGSASYRDQRGSVAAWLMSIVRYRAIDVARADEPHTSRRADQDLLEELAGPGDAADQIVAKAERERLLELLGRLPDTQREVITLAFYGGLSHMQIAEHLNLPPGTVKGRMRLGLHKLRAHDEPDDRHSIRPAY